jgi:hypothetical protein
MIGVKISAKCSVPCRDKDNATAAGPTEFIYVAAVTENIKQNGVLQNE